MKNITKSFGPLKANDSVDFYIRKGEIHALVGENGAGKTTLMRILYGMYQPDSGEIYINGIKHKIDSPTKAIKLGIGMVHQHFMLVKPMTVLENIILGSESVKKFDVIDFSTSQIKIRELLKSFSFNINLYDKIEVLPIGLEQRVEILKILYRNAEILILDEPTSVLTPQETDELFSILKNLSKNGKSIVLITHKLNEVMLVSDRITVLRHGKVMGVYETGNTTKEELAELMVGYTIEAIQNKRKIVSDETILEVLDLTVFGEHNIPSVKGVSFSINAGEILGVAGVEGNGQKELAETLTFIRPFQSGTIRINGKIINEQTVKSQRIAYVPDDRQESGLVLELTVFENLLLGRQREPQFSSFYMLKENTVRKYAEELVGNYDIRPQSPEQKVFKLSGGNQQKVVLSRELSKNTKLIVMNQPTRGLDIAAAEFIHRFILQQKEKGNAVLLLSSDLSELLKLSDRIAVMYEGRIAVILDAEGTNERELGLYMTGGNSTRFARSE